MSDLKPCPACGGKAILEEITDYDFYVECEEFDECGFAGQLRGTSEKAIEAWNSLPRRERWRSVTEELPEVPKFSSVQLITRDENDRVQTDRYSRPGGFASEAFELGDTMAPPARVTHWQPLPPGPGGEG